MPRTAAGLQRERSARQRFYHQQPRSCSGPGLGRLTVTAIAVGAYHACAVVDGAAYCWGDQYGAGQLGNNSTTSSPTPVPVLGLTSGVTSIACGGSHACALANGSAYCWGANDYGQLGNSATSAISVPVLVQGITSIDAISCRSYASYVRSCLRDCLLLG